jgi:L-ascorbate metabolism protein UlaG (beta-lactamase superfamily)
MADGAGRSAGAGTAGDRIVFLGHATVLIELDGVRLLSDPLLRARVAHLRRQAPSVDRTLTRGLDAVLISHLHHDHLDLASLRLLGRDVPLLVPAGAGVWLRRQGFATVSELAVGEETNVGALALAAVKACHDGRRLGGPRAESVGFLVRGRRAIYFAGDTARFPEMSGLAPRLDVALLPVGGWGPTLGPGHMDPLEAARAARLLAPRLAIPIHWGTFLPMGFVRHRAARLGDPPRRFAEHVARLAPDVEVRILAPGQETTF